VLLLARWLNVGALLGILTKNEVSAALRGADRRHDQARVTFQCFKPPFKYAAELSSVLSIPTSAQRKALPISATSSSRE
jgi:hypothetical protein